MLLVECRRPVRHHAQGVGHLRFLRIAQQLHCKAADAGESAATALVVGGRAVDETGLLGIVARLEALDRLLDAFLHSGQVDAGHLAGLERLQGPSTEGDVVRSAFGRRALHVVVPAACRRLTRDNARERLFRSRAGIRILRHAVRLAKGVRADQEAVLGSACAGHLDVWRKPVGILRLLAILALDHMHAVDQVVEGLLDGGAELLRGGGFAMGEEGEHREARTSGLVHALRETELGFRSPRSVRGLRGLQPAKGLHHGAFGVGVAVLRTALRVSAAHAGVACGAGDGLHRDGAFDVEHRVDGSDLN